MPFGKYRGPRINELPDHYLTWLLDNFPSREALRSAVEHEWHRRSGDVNYVEDLGGRGDDLVDGNDLEGDERALLREVIAAGFRTLYLKYRQQRGGSSERLERLFLLARKLGLLAA